MTHYKAPLDYDIIDIHTHFFPGEWFAAVWEFFETRGWRITYKSDPATLAATLRGFGVRRFSILNYLHKPGGRDALAEFTRAFAAAQPGALPFGALYPGESGNLDAARRWFDEWGFIGLKMQPLVTQFPICDPAMYPVFELMQERGRHLLIHAGTAPYANEFTHLDPLERLMADFPGLPVILAHMGAYAIPHALDMLDRFPQLSLDTAMVFTDTDVFDTSMKLDPVRLLPYRERILFGSDFPNIPYEYSEAVESILRLGLGDEFNRLVFRDNALRLFGL